MLSVESRLFGSDIFGFDWILIREVLRPQYFYNIFITNYKWLIVTGLNLNVILRLFFCPNNNNQ